VLDPTAANAFEYHQDAPAIDPADDVVVAAGAIDGGRGAWTLTLAPGAITGTVTDAAGPVLVRGSCR
jgi:hypothetical protein